MRRAWRPTWLSPISPSISALGTSAATESMTTMSIAPERISMSMISSACSPVSGWDTSRASVSTPSFLAYSGSSACSASMNAAMPPAALGVGHGVQRDGRLAGGLRAVDLDDPAPRQAADAERDVERDRPGGDHLDRGAALVTEAHDRALAELTVDLAERGLEGLLAVLGSGHVTPRVSKAADAAPVGLVMSLARRRYARPPTSDAAPRRRVDGPPPSSPVVTLAEHVFD